MTLFTTAIPVWLNVTCGQCGHHQEMQLGPKMQISDEERASDYECNQCGHHKAVKVNISGSSNANMRTAEEVRKHD